MNIFSSIRGGVAERMNLRYYLTLGMLSSGLFTFLFGLAYSTGIKTIYYFIVVQVNIESSYYIPTYLILNFFSLTQYIVESILKKNCSRKIFFIWD